jgi:hypothetical protein
MMKAFGFLLLLFGLGMVLHSDLLNFQVEQSDTTGGYAVSVERNGTTHLTSIGIVTMIVGGATIGIAGSSFRPLKTQ